MKKLLGSMLVMLPLLAVAQSGFDGTWRIDLNKAETKLMVFELKNGRYSCSTCDPKISIKANGQDQKVAGYSRVDTMRVTVVNDNTVERTGMKNGMVFRILEIVSPDGQTLTSKSEKNPPGSSARVMSTWVYSRLGTEEAGAHALSGSWKAEKLEGYFKNEQSFTYISSADGMSYKATTGASYNAKFDGKDYRYIGDPETTSISIKKISNTTIEETYKRDGTVTSVARISRCPEGKLLFGAVRNVQDGKTSTWLAKRQ